MSEEKNFPFNLSPLEGITLSSFIAIGFCIIYKTAYYNNIGVPWLINSLNPQLILISSIKFIFILLLFSLIGFLIIYSVRTNRNLALGVLLILTLLSCTFIIITTPTPPKILANSIDLKINFSFISSAVIAIMLGSFSCFGYINSKYILELKNIDSGFKKGSVSFYAILVSATLICFPYFIGAYEAKYILKYISKQNSVSIKDSSESWFIIELISDKAIIMDIKKEKIKIIEVKDINYIKKLD